MLPDPALKPSLVSFREDSEATFQPPFSGATLFYRGGVFPALCGTALKGACHHASIVPKPGMKRILE
jgi:hypothetical protein